MNPLSELEEKYLVSAAFTSDVANDTLTTLKGTLESTNVGSGLGV